MDNLTLLRINDIYGNDKIDIIKQYGSKSCITDFAVALDGFVLNSYYVNGIGLENRAGMWSTQSFYNDDSVFVVDHRGCKNITSNLKRQCGIRPVLLWNSLLNEDSIMEIQYGEYPQMLVKGRFADSLELLYNLDELEETGKIYTLDSAHNSDSNAKFMKRDFIEYFYEGKKYIRFEVKNSYSNGNLLSDGRKIHANDVYWFSVDPITWIVDFKNKLALSKKILLAGIQFNNYDKINDCFVNSDMYYFLNEFFIKDIIPSYEANKQLVKYYK